MELAFGEKPSPDWGETHDEREPNGESPDAAAPICSNDIRVIASGFLAVEDDGDFAVLPGGVIVPVQTPHDRRALIDDHAFGMKFLVLAARLRHPRL